MDLHHLKYVLVAAEEGSLQRASERLNVAPSALSRRIKDLEAELGIALFERINCGIRPSYAGRALICHARRIFAEMESAADHLRREAKGQTGVLRVGINGIAPQLPFVPAMFKAFRLACPGIELKPVSLHSDDQLAALRDGMIDAGILYTRPEDDPDLDYLRLASHRFVLALPARHKLAASGAIKLADLADEDFILFTEKSGPVIHRRLLANCHAGGLAPRIVQETHGEYIQLGLVAAGMGVSFVNDSVTARQSRPDVVIKEVTDLTVAEHLDLTWQKANSAAPLARLIGLAREAVLVMPG